MFEVMYEDVKAQKSVGEVWVEEKGLAGYVMVASLFVPSVVMVGWGMVGRNRAMNRKKDKEQ